MSRDVTMSHQILLVCEDEERNADQFFFTEQLLELLTRLFESLPVGRVDHINLKTEKRLLMTLSQTALLSLPQQMALLGFSDHLMPWHNKRRVSLGIPTHVNQL